MKPVLPMKRRRTVDEIAQELSQILRGLLVCVRAQPGLIETQREAIRSASPRRVAEANAANAENLREMASLEDRRQRLVVEAEEAGVWTGKGPITLGGLAERLPPALRGDLPQVAAELREAMKEASASRAVLRTAARTLSAHVEGLMKQVARSLSHAGTYGRRGSFESAPAVMTALDVRS